MIEVVVLETNVKLVGGVNCVWYVTVLVGAEVPVELLETNDKLYEVAEVKPVTVPLDAP